MSIQIRSHRRSPTIPTSRLLRTARTILGGLGSPDADLSIVLVGDDEIRALNRDWRGKDKATDVLSFSQVEGEGPAGDVLGDVVISLENSARQAAERGVTLVVEVERLLVHGVLHLLGHDHVHGGLQAR